MDDKQGEASYPQQNTFGDDTDNVDNVYDTEDSDDDNTFQYKFVPRPVVTSRVSKRSQGWTDQETFVLLEAWGERLLKHNRKCVPSEEWYEIVDMVSAVSKCKRNKTHCRNRMDSLKRIYKKEKAKLAENVGYSGKWKFFTKMDRIVCLNQADGNSRAHPICLNSADEVEESLVGESESAKGKSDNLDDLLQKKMMLAKEDNLVSDSDFARNKSNNLDEIPAKKMRKHKERSGGDPFKLIANCIDKYGEMYERLEIHRSQQLFELEKMRMEFKRELELEKMKIWMRGQVEIAKIRGVDIEKNKLSPDKVNGEL